MENHPPNPAAIAVVVVMVLIYTGLSYYSDSTPAALGLATGLSLAPILLIGAALLWRWIGRLSTSVVMLVVVALLYLEWSFLKQHYQWSNLIQQCGAYALASLGFARSLLAGQIPLCTQIMKKAHGPLTAAESVYTRRATAAWAAFYLLLTIAIFAWFLIGTLRSWSLFTNFGTYALIALMFGVDHLLRKRILPRRADGGIWTALRQMLGGP